MTPEQAQDAVARYELVVLRDLMGNEYARGRIISYSIVPAVTIVTESGERVSWRHDMAEVADKEQRQ